jgi:hypothetical protein
MTSLTVAATTYRSGIRYAIGASPNIGTVASSSVTLSSSKKALSLKSKYTIANCGKDWNFKLKDVNGTRWLSTEGSSSSSTGRKTINMHNDLGDKDSPMRQLYERTRDRGPVSWTQLFVVSVLAGFGIIQFNIERERRLEEHIGKIVSSESDGWSPDSSMFSKRKFVKTERGWWPVDNPRDGTSFVRKNHFYSTMYVVSCFFSKCLCTRVGMLHFQ